MEEAVIADALMQSSPEYAVTSHKAKCLQVCIPCLAKECRFRPRALQHPKMPLEGTKEDTEKSANSCTAHVTSQYCIVPCLSPALKGKTGYKNTR